MHPAPLLSGIAGGVLLVLLMMIPVLGLLVFVLVFVLGWGSTVVSGIGSGPNWLPRRFRRKAASAEA